MAQGFSFLGILSKCPTQAVLALVERAYWHDAQSFSNSFSRCFVNVLAARWRRELPVGMSVTHPSFFVSAVNLAEVRLARCWQRHMLAQNWSLRRTTNRKCRIHPATPSSVRQRTLLNFQPRGHVLWLSVQASLSCIKDRSGTTAQTPAELFEDVVSTIGCTFHRWQKRGSLQWGTDRLSWLHQAAHLAGCLALVRNVPKASRCRSGLCSGRNCFVSECVPKRVNSNDSLEAGASLELFEK